MIVLAIDPGSSQSAFVAFDTTMPGRVLSHDKWPNGRLLSALRVHSKLKSISRVVIEWTAPRGMPASAELFETMWWAGQFAEAAHPDLTVERLNRLEVKRRLCGSPASRDSNVRAALIDRFGGAGGKDAAIGRKATPGPLYGIAADQWAALAVAVVWADQQADRS